MNFNQTELYQYYQKLKWGQIPCSKELLQQYERIEKFTNDPNIAFDFTKADKPRQFIEKLCYLEPAQIRRGKIIKPPKKLKLELWQVATIQFIYGFVNATTGKRICKNATIIMGRKNGKSTLVAGLSLYHMTKDGVIDPEIYVVATSKDQARILFRMASSFIGRNKSLSKRIKANKSHFESHFNNGFFTPLSRDVLSQDGYNPSFCTFDEIHAYRKYEAIDVILSGQAARDEFLNIYISTNGTVRNSVFDEHMDYLQLVLSGTEEDDSTFAFIYKIDEEAEMWNEDNWIKANPNLGVTVDKEWLAKRVQKAKVSPKTKTDVLTKNMNLPRNSEILHFNHAQCIANDFNETIFNGMPAFLGLDVAPCTHYKNDLTALTLLYYDIEDNKYYFKDWHLIPKYYELDDQRRLNMVYDKALYDDIPYEQFAERGDLVLVDDVRITQEFLINFIKTEVIQKYNVQILKFGIDPNHATDIINHFNTITHDSKFCLRFLAERKLWTSPIIDLLDEIRDTGKVYDNNKLTVHHFASVQEKRDSNDYITFVNPPKTRKDMVIAHLAALSALEVWRQQKTNINGVEYLNEQRLVGLVKNAKSRIQNMAS